MRYTLILAIIIYCVPFGFAMETPVSITDSIRYFQGNLRQVNLGNRTFTVVSDGGLYTRRAITLGMKWDASGEFSNLRGKILVVAKSGEGEVYVDQVGIPSTAKAGVVFESKFFSDDDGNNILPSGAYLLTVYLTQGKEIRCVVFPDLKVEIQRNMPR